MVASYSRTYLASTTTSTELNVQSRLDERTYAKGRRITDHQLAYVHIVPDHFHGEWNYTIYPTNSEK